jgi:hypothetical protein
MARIGKNQLIQLQKRYRTDESIAKLYGLTRQGVHRIRTSYGIPPVAEKHAERDKEIVLLRNAGVSVLKLAKKFKLSATHIYRITDSGNQ